MLSLQPLVIARKYACTAHVPRVSRPRPRDPATPRPRTSSRATMTLRVPLDRPGPRRDQRRVSRADAAARSERGKDPPAGLVAGADLRQEGATSRRRSHRHGGAVQGAVRRGVRALPRGELRLLATPSRQWRRASRQRERRSAKRSTTPWCRSSSGPPTVHLHSTCAIGRSADGAGYGRGSGSIPPESPHSTNRSSATGARESPSRRESALPPRSKQPSPAPPIPRSSPRQIATNRAMSRGSSTAYWLPSIARRS